jgi:ribosomal protein RSM22 (predicted rRNA methylase)
VGHRPPRSLMEATVTIRLSIDRFEGDKKQIAVLLTEDDTAINFPRVLLPKGIRAGDMLTFQIERDVEATRELVDKTRKVQDQLEKTDPGGDLKL